MHKAILLMFLLVADVCIAEDEWTYLGTSSNNNSFSLYINENTLRVDSNKRKIWSMTDYKVKMDEFHGAMSYKTQLEVNCKEDKFRSIYSSYYSGNMGSGDVLGNTGEEGFTPIIPGSIGESLFEIICSLKKPLKR